MQSKKFFARSTSILLAVSLAGGIASPALSKFGLKWPSLHGKPPSTPESLKNPEPSAEDEPADEAPRKKPASDGDAPPALKLPTKADDEEPMAESDMQSEGEEGEDSSGKQDMSSNRGDEEAPLDVIEADPELHYRLAKQLVAKKKYTEGLQEINKCLELNKDYWDARYLGAYIYQLQDRVPESIHRYQDYVAHKPEDLQAHINLGVMLRKAGKTAEAEDQYKKAIDIKFYSLEAHYNLANLLIDEDRYEDALKQLRVCLKIAPTNAWVHNNLGVIYHKRNYLEEAADEFLRALNLEPANKVFEQNLTMVRQQMKRKPAKASIT